MDRLGSWAKFLQRQQAWIGHIRANARAISGWAIIALGIVGLVLPVLPGMVLILIGYGLTGKRFAWMDRLTAPLYQAMEAIPVQRLHPALQTLRIQPPRPERPRVEPRMD